MGKRFTATEKWQKAWFRKLQPKHKLVWYYLVDNCDNAGVWEIDLEMMSFQIGQEITEKDLQPFADKINIFCEDKLWLTDFVEFQYTALSDKSNFHKPIIAKLEKYNLTLNKGLSNPSLRVQDKDKYKDKDIDKEKGIVIHGKHLFKNSSYYDFSNFSEKLIEAKNAGIDLWHYYGALKDWSASKGEMRKDWIATARSWMRRDKQKNALVMSKKTGLTEAQKIHLGLSK
jgi:hypothetical protein